MKPVFSTLMAATLALLIPQIAEACRISKQWSQQDIAFADVIFEGSLTAVNEVPADKTAGGRKFFEFTFGVHDVVRGKLQQDEIVVGWMYPNYRNPSEVSLETLKKYFGETTRVAITTPELAGLFCEQKLRYGHFYDADEGKVVFSERMQPTCDYSADSLEPAIKENIPFVLSNGYICGRSYLFPVQMYEDMRNHEKNYEAFNAAFKKASATKEGRVAAFHGRSELYREMVPQGPLPWKSRASAKDSAVHLIRHHDVFFRQELKANMALQESLVDFGVAIARDEHRNRQAWFDRGETELVRFREDLKEEILRLLDYIEKDPEFRNRLLQDD